MLPLRRNTFAFTPLPSLLCHIQHALPCSTCFANTPDHMIGRSHITGCSHKIGYGPWLHVAAAVNTSTHDMGSAQIINLAVY